MKVAITAQGQEPSSMIDLRFGRARWILVVDTESGQYQVHDNAVQLNLPQGAGIQTGQNVANLGVEAVITGHVGPNAFRVLNTANIKIFLAAQQTVEQAVAAFKEGRQHGPRVRQRLLCRWSRRAGQRVGSGCAPIVAPGLAGQQAGSDLLIDWGHDEERCGFPR